MPTDSEFIDLPYAPVGGVNTYDSEDNIGDTEVADARNLLFEGKQCFARPGLATIGSVINDTIGSVFYVGGPYLILINSAGTKIYACALPNSVPNEFQVTGPAITLIGGFISVDYVNGVYLIAGNSGGLIRWDWFAGTVYTLIATAPFQFVAGHYSRAVAAYNLTVSSTIQGLDFDWSVPGDETVWTVAPGLVNGSGKAIINDANGTINSLSIVKNVVVISAGTGIHLAYATGNGASPYNIQKWTSKIQVPIFGAPGAYAPKVFNNLLYYITANGDVCTFDLAQVQSIGTKIQKTLLLAIQGRTVGNDVSTAFSLYDYAAVATLQAMVPRFHIFVKNPGVYWHFSYNILEGVWSIHEYDPAMALLHVFSIPGISNLSFVGPAFYQNISPTNNVYKYWSPGTACERAPYFKGKLFVAEKPEVDYTLNRVLVGTRDYGVQSTTVSVESRLGRQKNVAAVTRNTGSASNDGFWGREWFDMLQPGTGSATGQMFQATVTGAVGSKFACNYVGLRFSNAGDFRG